jgi:transcriptional regulator with XRE-family HTH domain
MPELELLALFLNIPIEHFWGKQALSRVLVPGVLQDRERMVQLRNQVIGTNLRLSRNNAGLAYQEITARTGIPEEKIRQYEMGEAPVSVPDLESIAWALDIPIEHFYDQHGPIGKWREQQGTYQMFLELPPEIQQFVSRPVNRPYLEVAMRLSELSADKLRAVAEVLLEITY